MRVEQGHANRALGPLVRAQQLESLAERLSELAASAREQVAA
jgi:hypothetical protein